MKLIYAAALPVVLFALASCGPQRGGEEAFDRAVYAPRHAVGFEIRATSDADDPARLLVTRSPWQGSEAESVYRHDGADAERIVVMSSSHVAMLDALGAADRIVGVSGKDFISTPSVEARLDSIGDVGYEGNVDYERLVSLRPDVVMLYGVNGASSMEGKLRELGIPYVYIGDYMEESPLGKAEWMRFIAEIVGKTAVADSLMSEMSEKYSQLRGLAATATDRPSVMLNMPYGDAWYLPTPGGYMPQLIADAGGRYLYDVEDSRTSVPVDYELAYALLNRADVWLNTGSATTFAELGAAAPKLASVSGANGLRVYNNNARLTRGGGNDFWESSAVHPDRVLADLIAILHPDMLPDHQLYYYRRLQ